jgi:DNA modification methylase
MRIWKDAGFYPVSHFVWPKRYASGSHFARYQHEQAYLLAKGHPRTPDLVLPDVLAWRYTGNRLHPTQKPLGALRPLIKAFSQKGEIVLDPFAGSGTTALAALLLGRRYIGIEVREDYATIAQQRLRRKGGEPPMTEPTTTPNAAKYPKSPYPKFWLKCTKCQAFVSASPQSVFRYIAKLLKVELDALDTRYTKAAKEGHQATEQ